jgi:hypothetical protein
VITRAHGYVKGVRRERNAIRLRRPVILIVAAMMLAVGACDEAEETAKEAGARASAEVVRVSLKAQDLKGRPGGVRNVEVLREAADDLPGKAEVVGIHDGNGDGIDDEGLVEVKVEDEYACVTLPETGENIDVSGGRCS